MKVLHGLWDGGLVLWAESSQRQPPRKARSSHAPVAHPFAAPVDDLTQIVQTLAHDDVTAAATSRVIQVLLPSAGNAPLPSPDMASSSSTSTASLRTWQAPALRLNPSLSLDLLLDLPTQPSYEIILGNSLQYWAQTAKFALELATRQSMAPTVECADDGSYRAAWRAVIAGADEDRAFALAHAMPPICRALVPIDDATPASSVALLSNFLNHTLDALAREGLSKAGWLPKQTRSKRKSTPLALHEQWLHALAASDPTLEGDAAKLEAFSSEVNTWLKQLAPSAQQTPFRTCFRLIEPPDEHHDWQIDYFLQANDDRSLLVPAEHVWRERSSTLTFLKHKFENPQERLLQDLGRASRLSPLLEKSLNTARPSGTELGVEQAYRFLRESAPLLEQSGFGVMLPAWWRKPSTQLSVHMQLRPKQGPRVTRNLMGQNAVVEYHWQLALGDQTLNEDEFEALARLKTPLVQVRGQWVELRRDEIERAIAFFKKKQANSQIDLGEALHIGLGQELTEVGLPVTEVVGEGWLDDLLKRLTDHTQIPAVDIPHTFNGQLRPYQLRGVAWLSFLRQYNLGACLADDMGLGKTPSMIAALLAAHETGATAPSLVICPMSIVGNWQRELQRFAPSLRVLVHHGTERLAGASFERTVRQNDVVLTTYSLVPRDAEQLSRVTWDYIVLDEAQNIKNPSTKQTQAISRLNGAHRVALTGTPVENRLSDLWSIMNFLNKGYLGTERDFHTRYAAPIERYHDANQSAALKRLIQPLILRRLKTDKTIITDLPEKLEMKVLCNLTPEQATLYQAVVNDMLKQIDESEGIQRRGLVLATLLKLKQVCNHPAHFLGDGSTLLERSGKLARLKEMLDEALAVGDKALIFTQFAEMGNLLRTHLQDQLGHECLFLHGGTSKKQRDEMVQRFQSEAPHSPPLFILSIKAGGVGLNLTAANHVFHFDRWWNPAVENQATDRAFRIGQQKNVQVHKFICVGTLEERIDMLIEQKKDLAERIVGAGESWLTELSTDQLRDLFTLSREAVGE
jgi:SNF2 family DNA or RNA helicase